MTSPPAHRRTAAVSIVWALLWAGAFVATKIAVAETTPAATVALRCGIAGIIMLMFTWRHVPMYTAAELARTTVIGLLNNCGYLAIIAAALPHLSAGLAAILSSLTPLAIIILTAVATRRAAPRRLVGVGIGFVGVALSSLSRLDSETATAGGVGLGLLGVSFLIAATYLTPRLLPPGNPYFLTSWQALTGAVPIAFIALATTTHLTPTPTLVAAIAFLVFGATIIGMTLWLNLINTLGAEQASIAHFLPPLIGIALGATVLGEPVTLLELASVVPVALGVYLATKKSRATLSDLVPAQSGLSCNRGAAVPGGTTRPGRENRS